MSKVVYPLFDGLLKKSLQLQGGNDFFVHGTKKLQQLSEKTIDDILPHGKYQKSFASSLLKSVYTPLCDDSFVTKDQKVEIVPQGTLRWYNGIFVGHGCDKIPGIEVKEIPTAEDAWKNVDAFFHHVTFPFAPRTVQIRIDSTYLYAEDLVFEMLYDTHSEQVLCPSLVQMHIAPGAHVRCTKRVSKKGGFHVWSHTSFLHTIGREARLTLVEAQDTPAHLLRSEVTRVDLQDHAEFTDVAIGKHEGKCHQDVCVMIQGEQTKVDMRGGHIVLDNGMYECTQRVEHLGNASESLQKLRVLAANKGKAVVDVDICIPQGVGDIRAREEVKGMVMHPEARVYARPLLHISSSDVAVTHGVALGEIRTDEVMYMRQRGISESIAKKLLLQGFLSEILHGIDHVTVREHMENVLPAYLQLMKL